MRPFGFQTISIERLIRKPSYFVLFVSVMLAVWYQSRILEYIEWGDESETIVAAKMLAAGMSRFISLCLYSLLERKLFLSAV